MYEIRIRIAKETSCFWHHINNEYFSAKNPYFPLRIHEFKVAVSSLDSKVFLFHCSDGSAIFQLFHTIQYLVAFFEQVEYYHVDDGKEYVVVQLKATSLLGYYPQNVGKYLAFSLLVSFTPFQLFFFSSAAISVLLHSLFPPPLWLLHWSTYLFLITS